MKGKISILAVAIALVACSEESQIAEIVAPEGGAPSSGRSMATVEIVDYVPGDGTRAVLNTTAGSSPVFSWEQGDVLGVYAGGENTGLTNLSIKTIDSSAPSKAIFHATGFNMNSGETYHGFFPYTSAATDKTKVPVKFSGKNYAEGITQTENDGYRHLGAIDYQWATATAYGTSDAADINFTLKHLSAICRFRITGVPAGVKFSRLSISCAGIITDGIVDLTAGTPTIIAASGNQTTQNIALGNEAGNGFAAASDGTLTVYTLMAPVNLSGKKITLSLYSDQSDMVMWSGTVSGKNMLAGKSYSYTAAYGATSGTETDTWVDLGLTRDDGSRILFGTKNLGAGSETAVGTMPEWTAQDPVQALRGSNWRTPSQLELHKLFSDSDASLTKEVTSDGITISNTKLKTSLFIPFTDAGNKACRYWTSTATASYWPALAYGEDNSNLQGAGSASSKYCQLEVQSDRIAYNLGNISQSTTTPFAIRPVYVGPDNK